MQNRYVGDIGDYLKLAILRALSPGFSLGVAWWLYPDESHNGDGRHVSYLDRPDQWRCFDPQLFDALDRIVSSGHRNIRALERASVLSDATFASEPIPSRAPICQRQQARRDWVERVQQKLADTDLVFLDPDNGLEPAGFRPMAGKSGKSIMLSELTQFARPARCLIVYHHQSRRRGGHHAEMAYWTDQLSASGFTAVDALRAKPFSPRLYFLLDAPALIRQRAEQVALDWRGLITWHPCGNMHVPLSRTDRAARTAITTPKTGWTAR
jgi:hypothetical protein